jgi:hypothetical protein
LKRRGGKALSSAVEVIDQNREERDHELLGH